MSVVITVNGVDASLIAPHSLPSYETLASGGMGDASWTWQLPEIYGDPATERGALVAIWVAARRVWFGYLDSIEQSSGSVRCTSMWAAGETIPALTATGTATRDVGVALATAANATYQWRVTNRRGVSGVAAGDLSEPLMMTDLLTQRAAQLGRRTGVDAGGDVYMRLDQTTPIWIIDATGLDLGGMDGGRLNQITGRYRTPTGVVDRATTSGTPTPPVRSGLADLTPYGRLSASEAVAILDSLLARMSAQPGWTQPLVLNASRVRTIGGQEANLPAITGGDPVRIYSMAAVRLNPRRLPYLDATLESVTQQPATEEVVVAPAGASAASLQEALERMMKERR